MQLTRLGATCAKRVGFLHDTSPNIGYFRKKILVVIFVSWKFLGCYRKSRVKACKMMDNLNDKKMN
jgi:hypothetical protein